MKIHSKVLISSLLIVPVLTMGTAWAHDLQVAEDSTSSSSNTSTQSHTETEAEKENEADSKLTLQQRLDKRKTALKTTLQAAEKLKLETKCSGAQGIIKSVENRSTSAEKARTNVYTKLDARLGTLITKLKAAKVDTSTLEQQRTALEVKIKTFNTDMTTYKQAVSDLAAMDCKSDPTAFKASLDSARTQREKLKNDAAEIRTYVTGTIKPTLQDVRKTLADQKTSQENQ